MVTKDCTSLPFAKVQAFSVETAGTFDLDAGLELWFWWLGRVKFELNGNTDVTYLNRLVARHVLRKAQRLRALLSPQTGRSPCHCNLSTAS
ncbi:MAG: PH domain-containing protein [Ornithinimicrobium sp.]